jgi:O-methyltransferase involved in polyketide biosynthesis
VLEDAWLDTVSAHRQRPFLFLAEGVFQFFEEAQVKSLVLTLRDRFPYAELVFDAYTPFELWVGNLQISRSKLGNPCALGDLARPGDRKMGRRNPPPRRVGILRPA